MGTRAHLQLSVPSDWMLCGNLADIGRSGGGFAAVDLDDRCGDERGEVTDGEQHNTGNFVSSSEKSDQETDAPVNGSHRRPPSLVVGIGASAGGLAAYRSFFDHTPHDTGMAFILVQHLDPNHKSLLVDLLRLHPAMGIVGGSGSDGACAKTAAATRR